jgi:hypothetical protein
MARQSVFRWQAVTRSINESAQKFYSDFLMMLFSRFSDCPNNLSEETDALPGQSDRTRACA